MLLLSDLHSKRELLILNTAQHAASIRRMETPVYTYPQQEGGGESRQTMVQENTTWSATICGRQRKTLWIPAPIPLLA